MTSLFSTVLLSTFSKRERDLGLGRGRANKPPRMGTKGKKKEVYVRVAFQHRGREIETSSNFALQRGQEDGEIRPRVFKWDRAQQKKDCSYRDNCPRQLYTWVKRVKRLGAGRKWPEQPWHLHGPLVHRPPRWTPGLQHHMCSLHNMQGKAVP